MREARVPPEVHPITPGAGQESVWDYPRPPRIEEDDREIVVRIAGTEIARSTRAKRVLETSLPPSFYLPPAHVRTEHLEASSKRTICEFKGKAIYLDIVVEDERARDAAFGYPDPSEGFEAIAGHVSFHPDRVECLVDGEQARAQKGGFYAGWITSDVVGPFKGAPGTQHW